MRFITYFFPILVLVIMFYATIRIVQRAGYHWIWAVLMYVPGLNIILYCLFAFRPWPIHKFVEWQGQKIQEYENIINQYQEEIDAAKRLGH